MTAEIKKFEEILGSVFSIDNYVALIGEIFSTVRTVSPYKQQKEWSNFSSHIVGYSHVANYVTPDDKKLIILAVELQKNSYVETSRSTQRSYAKKLIENSNSDAAVIAFYMINEKKWRLSFVRLDYEMKFENGTLKAVENITPARRYSFLVGEDEPSHTAIERLHSFIIDQNSQPTLDELEEVFSVEKVTKEFFDLYCEKYHELREHLLTNEDFLEESEKCGFTVEQFAKKLMGQIVFLYFLQKKGWLGVGVWPKELTEKQYNNVYFTRGAQGRLIKEYLPQVYVQRGDKYVLRSATLDMIPDDAEEMIANNLPKDESKNWGSGSKRFLRTLFEFSKRRGANFYEDYLEPLFYGTLNKNRGTMGYSPLLHCRIPFLSGGLFEPINGYQWEISNFNIPDDIFSNKTGDDDRSADGILDIFDRYNFTMSEDEPMEREVAIDPEMLGKVFENLLDVTDRKSKGAFYTPREIVHYMCQESLINYLVNATGISEVGVRDLILYGDFMKDEDTVKTVRVVDENGKAHMKFDYSRDMYISEDILSFKNGINRLNEIDNALADIRVADPAVGSGAFPLGMLNEIVRARQCLTEYMALVVAKPAVSDAQSSFFIRELRRDRTAYDLKRHAIKNSIFAVDIEPSAVDIAQLRLWLSLVIDDEINPDASNMLDGHTNPLPLPNLECNILCGNSLIDEYEGVALLNQSELLGIHRNDGQRNFATNAFEAVLPKLLEAQDKLFYCDDPVKKSQLMEEIASLKDMAIEPQLYAMPSEIRERYEKAKNLASCPFILWQLDFARVFRDKGGFDVVIGNPPYIGEKGNKELFRPVAATEFGRKYYYGKMDYFYFFFHKALDLGNEKAEITLITTNYYPTAFGGKILRKDFKERADIRRLINFNDLKIFESALGQHNMITMLTKKKANILANNCICKISAVADSHLLKHILYAQDSSEFFDVYNVSQGALYDGTEVYIRIMGCGGGDEDSVESILCKIADGDYLLRQIAIIKQGIVSGADKYTDAHQAKYGLNHPKGKGIFVLNSESLEELNLPVSESERFVKEVYKNSQISKYHIDYRGDLWVFYLNKDVSEDEAPNIIKYLEQFKPILASKRETIEGKMPWYSLNWARDKTIFEDSEKIVNSRRSKSNIFALETRHCYEQSDIMITIIKPEYKDLFPAKYVLAVLNSKLYYVWLKNRGKLKGEMLELYGKPLEEIPFKLPSDEQKMAVVGYVNDVLDADGNDLSARESIDRLIYNIYNLTDKEILIVEKEAR